MFVFRKIWYALFCYLRHEIRSFVLLSKKWSTNNRYQKGERKKSLEKKEKGLGKNLRWLHGDRELFACVRFFFSINIYVDITEITRE